MLELLSQGVDYTAEEIACAVDAPQLDVEQYLFLLVQNGRLKITEGKYQLVIANAA
jgi:hypothetical protein